MTQQLGSVEVDVRANLAPLRAGFAQAESEARAFGKAAEATLGTGLHQAGLRASQSIRRTEFDLQNLRFQINDVATSLLSGSSPFMVLSQQAGQFSQILDRQGGGIRGAVGLLGQAFLGMLNPVNLAIAGIGVATYAATSFFSATEDGADEANEALKRHERAIRDLKSAWGEAAKGVVEYISKSPILVEGALADSNEEMASRTRDSVADQITLFNTLTQAVREQIAAGGELASTTVENYEAWKLLLDPVDELVRQLETGAVPNAEEFQKTMQQIRSNPDLPDEIREVAKQLQGATAEAYKFWQAWAAGSVASQAAIQDRFNNLPPDQDFSPQGMHPKPPSGGAPGFRGALQSDVDRASGRGGRGSKADPFASAMDRAGDRLRALENERTALGLTGEALARYRAEMQFIASVQSDWTKLTEEQKAALEDQAHAIGDSAVAVEALKDKQRELKDAQREAEDAFAAVGDAAENLFMGMMQGGDAAKQAIAQLVAELLRAAILGDGPLSFFFKSGLGGLVGGAVGGGVVPKMGPQSVPSGRIPGGARSAGVSNHFGGHSIVVQGNMDSATMAQLETRLRQHERAQAQAANERAKNGWRTN